MLNKLVVTTPKFTPICFQNGVNLILGTKENSDETYNSVGKTLLLRLIDYLFGSTQSAFSQFNRLKTEKVIGSFSFDCGKLEISRPLANPSLKLEIIDSSISHLEKGKSITPKEWRNWLTEYYWPDSTKGSFRIYSNILNKFDSINNFDNAIKPSININGTTAGIHSSYLLCLSASSVISNNDFTFTPGDRKVLSKMSKTIEKSLVHLPVETLKNLDSLTLECDKAYQTLNNQIISNEKNKRILRTLKLRLEELNSLEPTSFNKNFYIYQKELGEYLKKNYQDAFKFHSSLIEENKTQINKRIETLEKELSSTSKEIKELEMRTSEVSEKLSEYADSSLADSPVESYILRRFLSRKTISEVVTQAEKKLCEEHNAKVVSLLNNEKDEIARYRDFLNEMYKDLFSDTDESVFFDVSYTKNNVFKITLSLPNDSGEGIGSLKSLMFLFLLTCINARKRHLDYMFIDSACVDSIDRDLFSRFLRFADKTSKDLGVQFICAINDQNANIQELKEINRARTLTPQNNLFGMDLTSDAADIQQ